MEWQKTHTFAKLLWVSATPVITECSTVEYVRCPADIVAYNAIEPEIMTKADIPINDLCILIASNSIPDCIGKDGVDTMEPGNVLFARGVAQTMQEAASR